MPAFIYRFGAAGSALLVFVGISYLYKNGYRELYDEILRSYGILPFQFPFVDISGSLAAWECARAGADVILSDPCDVLHRGYTYSPLWMAASGIPLGVRDTTAVGWSLDLLFIVSLSLVPPPRRWPELVLVLMATLSTMVVFALERANPDILLFMLALMAGLLGEGRLVIRLLGYSVALLAALIKYYPITVLIIVFRERISILVAVLLIVVGSLVVFWANYHLEIARGFSNIPGGRYDTDLFAAKNLPFLMGMVAESAAEPSTFRALLGHITTVGLYAVLVAACAAICWRLLRLGELRAALTSLRRLERVLLVIGSAVVVGCFFAGQSIAYRGVFLLLVIPGILAISRVATRELRNLATGTGVVIVLLMWGECLRLALFGALERLNVSEDLASSLKMQFWLLRELSWWWAVSIMLAVLCDFLWDSPVVRRVSAAFDRLAERAR
jgi:hypothetical protein